MPIFSKERNNPLHLAVIQDDASAAEIFVSDKELFLEANELGFTPYELALFLRRKEILRILEPQRPPLSIKIQLPDKEEISLFTKEDFSEAFNINYARTLHFANYQVLKSCINHSLWNSNWLLFSRESHLLGKQYQHKFIRGDIADLSIRWIDNTLGYGVFADSPIDEGGYVGEYTGIVRRQCRFYSDPNAYCFHYPGRFWSTKFYVVDALHEGNITRFINHSDIPNLSPICMVDRGLTHIAFLATRLISQGEQLTIDYGKNYWQRRIKQQL